MKKSRINHTMLIVEITVYLSFALIFAVFGVFNIVSDTFAEKIYISFILISFAYLLSLEFVFKKYDNAVHFKMYKKYYSPIENKKHGQYKREGLTKVIFLWTAYLLVVFILDWFGILLWWVFLIGACIMFALNSFFTRRNCLLSKWILKNKNNCCKNCGINGWDNAIFASALLFAPKFSMFSSIANGIIIAISAVNMIMWEVKYKKYPYRFYSDTNRTLSCDNCLKQCKLKSE